MKKISFLWLGLLFAFLTHCSSGTTSNPPPSEVVVEGWDWDEEDEWGEEEMVEPTSEKAYFTYEKREWDPSFKDHYTGKTFDYDRKPKEKKKSNFNFPHFQISPLVVKIFIYSFLGLILIGLVYLIIKNAGGFSFGESRKKINVKISDQEDLIDDEEIENNDFERLVEKAKAEKDYRRATRYYYLWILQSLSDKKIIKWNRDKTNLDYLTELKQHPIHQEFSYNTFLYDYIWYGKFPIGEMEFSRAEHDFKLTLNRIK